MDQRFNCLTTSSPQTYTFVKYSPVVVVQVESYLTQNSGFARTSLADDQEPKSFASVNSAKKSFCI